jgi:hypothetical protein
MAYQESLIVNQLVSQTGAVMSPRAVGTAVLVAGTIVVANPDIKATSKILLTSQIPGGTIGFLSVSARVVGTSFTILSSNALDTSTVAYFIVE